MALPAMLAVPALADPVADFYKGKQIRVIVRTTPGGDYDQYTRLLARFMGKHIPGNPSMIVVNMPGGGGITAANYMAQVAPRDGTVIGMPSRSMPAAAVMKVANVRFDPVKFNWIGSPEVNHLVVYINNATAIKQPADLFEREVIMGATGLAQGITVGPYLLKNLLGMKLKIVTGYRSPGEVVLAVTRGEVGSLVTTVGGPVSARRQWVTEGKMRVLFNMEGERVPWLGAPTIFDFTKTDEQRQVLAFFAGNTQLGRPLMAPPGVPAERVAALRRAFDATAKDPAFLKEAESMGFEVSPQTGEQILSRVMAAIATPADIVRRAERAAAAD
jgi:tripartite-type tricarboxylate transporter receptor subunit TctC